MKPLVLIVSALILLGLALVWSYRKDRQSTATAQVVTVYCAAGMKKPAEAVAEQYRKEYGVQVNFQFGGTVALLSQIENAPKGDLFIAADEHAIGLARDKGLIEEVLPLAYQYPVIAVQKGNPKGVKGMEDLFRDDLRVAVGNKETASIGKATRAVMGERWEELLGKVAVTKTTVMELAADLSFGAVDAAVIWNSTVPQFDKLEAVKVDHFTAHKDKVTVSVLGASESPASALKFARYMNAPGKGSAVFSGMNYEAIEGDEWAEKPVLILYSGGVNRPAISETLKEFANREGVNVDTMFNGCGVLCAAMQAMNDTSNPRFPDAYYACDLCFVPPVEESFPEAVLLTETVIGIAVPKGNPKNIRTLADLGGPELKVGINNAQQSTLGFMTAGMLKQSALEEAVRRNVRAEVPTADLLINQIRTGSLDAVVVYEVNYKLAEDYLDFIRIDHEGARAVQPFAVRVDSPRKLLGQRLLACMQKNRARFEESGFTWIEDQKPVKSSELEIPPWLLQPGKR